PTARDVAHASFPEELRVRREQRPGDLHGKILNAAFTMFKPAADARGSICPGAGQTVSISLSWISRARRLRAGSRLTIARVQELARLLAGHRLSEIPALPDAAAEPDDRLVRVLALDSLHADGHRQCGGKRGHRANDRGALALGAEVGDELAIDLDDVE